MNLVGKKVSHNRFGQGRIIELTEKYVTVEFEEEVKTFQYPICFDLFLTLLNDDLKDKMAQEIEVIKEDERKKEEEKREEYESQIMRTYPLKRQNSIIREKKQKMDILAIHASCFEFLLDYQKKNSECYFLPRQTNNRNRLEEGYYFIGNKSYLMTTFWRGVDSLEKIYNINFGIEQTGQAFIEISSRDNEIKSKYLGELVTLLEEKLNTPYSEVKAGKWRRNYPVKLSYLEALDRFILNEKEIIDEFIKKNENSGLKFIDVTTFQKAIQRVLILKKPV